MSAIRLVPLGALPRARLEHLAEHLARLLGMKAEPSHDEVPLDGVFDPRRDQYRSDLLLEQLNRSFPSEPRVLGVTDSDLFIPVLTFVFGEAHLGGRAAVISSYRLRNELYGLPADKALLEDRLVKEAMHELGHTFGLLHCRNLSCVMQQSTYAEMVDLKPPTYCADCRTQYETFITRNLKAAGGAPPLWR